MNIQATSFHIVAMLFVASPCMKEAGVAGTVSRDHSFSLKQKSRLAESAFHGLKGLKALKASRSRQAVHILVLQNTI